MNKNKANLITFCFFPLYLVLFMRFLNAESNQSKTEQQKCERKPLNFLSIAFHLITVLAFSRIKSQRVVLNYTFEKGTPRTYRSFCVLIISTFRADYPESILHYSRAYLRETVWLRTKLKSSGVDVVPCFSDGFSTRTDCGGVRRIFCTSATFRTVFQGRSSTREIHDSRKSHMKSFLVRCLQEILHVANFICQTKKGNG